MSSSWPYGPDNPDRQDRADEARNQVADPSRITGCPCKTPPPTKIDLVARFRFRPSAQRYTFKHLDIPEPARWSRMQYRGKSYTIVQSVGPDRWKWTIRLDEKTIKSGEAPSRA